MFVRIFLLSSGLFALQLAACSSYSCPPGTHAAGDIPPRALEAWCEDATGVAQGLLTRWYPSHAVKAQASVKDGLQVGLTTLFYEDGRKAAEIEFGDGLPNGALTFWLRDGSKLMDGRYRNGKLHGPASIFRSDGDVYATVTYLDGVMNGPTKVFHTNGKLQQEGIFADGLPVGPHRGWFEDGKPEEVANYLPSGKEDGLTTKWHRNGTKASEATFRNGRRLTGRAWDMSGHIIAAPAIAQSTPAAEVVLKNMLEPFIVELQSIMQR